MKAVKKDNFGNIISYTFPVTFAACVIGTICGMGGITGKQLFNPVAAQFTYPDKAGGVQASLLFIATFATLIYTIKKEKITPKQVKSAPPKQLRKTEILGQNVVGGAGC